MSEYHVCGVLLMSRPEKVTQIQEVLATMSGVELHANEGGRMVVTIEGADYGHCADTMNELATLDGVASSSLVYHQIDTESVPEESVQ